MKLIENEWFISAPWGRLCIVAWGDCLNPPVLVLHGSGDSLASFRPLLKLLPPNFYYVGLEFPGKGRSDHYPPGFTSSTLMDFAHCIEIVRRHFRWDSFILLAHSMGATTGRLYNLAHPGKVIRAIEIDQTIALAPQPFPLEKWYKVHYVANYKGEQKQNSHKYTWEQAIEKVTKNRPELTPELARATIERWSEPAGKGLIRFTFDSRWTRGLFPPFFVQDQAKAVFTSIPTPTLAIVAEDSINRNLYRNTPFLIENYGNYRIRKVKGDHDVHVAHPERVAPFISQFLMYGSERLDSKAKL